MMCEEKKTSDYWYLESYIMAHTSVGSTWDSIKKITLQIWKPAASLEIGLIECITKIAVGYSAIILRFFTGSYQSLNYLDWVRVKISPIDEFVKDNFHLLNS